MGKIKKGDIIVRTGNSHVGSVKGPFINIGYMFAALEDSDGHAYYKSGASISPGEWCFATYSETKAFERGIQNISEIGDTAVFDIDNFNIRFVKEADFKEYIEICKKYGISFYSSWNGLSKACYGVSKGCHIVGGSDKFNISFEDFKKQILKIEKPKSNLKDFFVKTENKGDFNKYISLCKKYGVVFNSGWIGVNTFYGVDINNNPDTSDRFDNYSIFFNSVNNFEKALKGINICTSEIDLDNYNVYIVDEETHSNFYNFCINYGIKKPLPWQKTAFNYGVLDGESTVGEDTLVTVTVDKFETTIKKLSKNKFLTLINNKQNEQNKISPTSDGWAGKVKPGAIKSSPKRRITVGQRYIGNKIQSITIKTRCASIKISKNPITRSDSW